MKELINSYRRLWRGPKFKLGDRIVVNYNLENNAIIDIHWVPSPFYWINDHWYYCIDGQWFVEPTITKFVPSEDELSL